MSDSAHLEGESPETLSRQAGLWWENPHAGRRRGWGWGVSAAHIEPPSPLYCLFVLSGQWPNYMRILSGHRRTSRDPSSMPGNTSPRASWRPSPQNVWQTTAGSWSCGRSKATRRPSWTCGLWCWSPCSTVRYGACACRGECKGGAVVASQLGDTSTHFLQGKRARMWEPLCLSVCLSLGCRLFWIRLFFN